MRNFGIASFSVNSSAHQLTIAIVVASILFGLLGPIGVYYLAFNPLLVLYEYRVWQPVTSLLIAPSPTEVIFGGLIVYSIGGNLEMWLGRRKFWALTLGIPLSANVLTLLAALIFPSLFIAAIYTGVSSILTTVWIVFGLRAWFRREQLNFWGVPITGKTFAVIGLGFVVLQGVFNGFLRVFPELLSAMLCYGYMYRGGSFNPFRPIEIGYYNWKLRRLKAKRGGLRIVPPKKSKNDREDDYSIN